MGILGNILEGGCLRRTIFCRTIKLSSQLLHHVLQLIPKLFSGAWGKPWAFFSSNSPPLSPSRTLISHVLYLPSWSCYEDVDTRENICLEKRVVDWHPLKLNMAKHLQRAEWVRVTEQPWSQRLSKWGYRQGIYNSFPLCTIHHHTSDPAMSAFPYFKCLIELQKPFLIDTCVGVSPTARSRLGKPAIKTTQTLNRTLYSQQDTGCQKEVKPQKLVLPK